MRKIIILLFLFFFYVPGHSFPLKEVPKSQAAQTYVYICDSATSIAYHSSQSCRGLNRCTHKIIKVTLEDAKKLYRKRACHLCE